MESSAADPVRRLDDAALCSPERSGRFDRKSGLT